MISTTGSAGTSSFLSAPLEGIRRGMAQAGDAAEKIAQGDFRPETIVAQIQASALVRANAAVARSSQEMMGSLLDALA